MSNYQNRWTVLLTGAIAVSLAGCSFRPSAVKVPPINAQEAAKAAFSKYDTNGDGLLSNNELTSCPALVDAMKNHIDKDHDKKLSVEELTNRLAMWVDSGVGASYFTCRVMKKGRPLAGAEVTLVPEVYLDGVIQPAVGVTNKTGSALMAIDSANLPSDLQNLRAVQPGHYRVAITHPSVSIPPKYNTESTLGVEVSFESGRNLVTFNL
ncbi:MAG: EF-hand domain-containing protein [Planctomycetales bacterium]|nr:EF-hand domain-containing protein [Planctomycetales bacterium]